MFLITDELLERFTCSECKKYLSVKPIKVYPNRGIKCGRCSKVTDAGVVSLFGVLAEQALFRCIQRFEGCNQLLSYADVAEHEMSCIGEKYDCPCCTETFKGTAYDIYVHFKEQHSNQLLVNTSEFIVEIDSELLKTYLYRKNDLLFYVNAEYNKGNEELILNARYLGTDRDASDVSQRFTLNSLDAKLKFKTQTKRCCSVREANVNSFKIIISPKDFSKNVIVCKLYLNTENLENLVVLPENFKKRKTELGDEANIMKLSMGTVFNAMTTSGSGIKQCIFGNDPLTILNKLPASGSACGFPPPRSISSTFARKSAGSKPSTFGKSTTLGQPTVPQPFTFPTNPAFNFGSSAHPVSENTTSFGKTSGSIFGSSAQPVVENTSSFGKTVAPIFGSSGQPVGENKTIFDKTAGPIFGSTVQPVDENTNNNKALGSFRTHRTPRN